MMNQEYIQPVVTSINSLGLGDNAAPILAGVFTLHGTGSISLESLWRAWTAYQATSAFKSYTSGAQGVRAAS